MVASNLPCATGYYSTNYSFWNTQGPSLCAPRSALGHHTSSWFLCQAISIPSCVLSSWRLSAFILWANWLCFGSWKSVLLIAIFMYSTLRLTCKFASPTSTKPSLISWYRTRICALARCIEAASMRNTSCYRTISVSSRMAILLTAICLDWFVPSPSASPTCNHRPCIWIFAPPTYWINTLIFVQYHRQSPFLAISLRANHLT